MDTYCEPRRKSAPTITLSRNCSGDSSKPNPMLNKHVRRTSSEAKYSSRPPSSRHDIRRIFSQNLKSARRARKWSQEELAHHAGIDRTYVSSLERGSYAASIDMVQQLADVLEVHPWQMLMHRAQERRRRLMSPFSIAVTDTRSWSCGDMNRCSPYI